MPSTPATVQVRTDKKTKKEAQEIAQSLGMSLSTAVNIFLKSFVSYRGLPFHIRDETLLERSIRQSEDDLKNGRFTSFETGEELVKHLSQL